MRMLGGMMVGSGGTPEGLTGWRGRGVSGLVSTVPGGGGGGVWASAGTTDTNKTRIASESLTAIFVPRPCQEKRGNRCPGSMASQTLTFWAGDARPYSTAELRGRSYSAHETGAHMRYFAVAGLLALAATAPTAAQETDHPLLHQVAGEVSPDALHATIARLVGFGTRHSLSGNPSPTRGIVAAQAYVKSEFAKISARCSNCLDIETPAETFTGNRAPTPTQFMDVLGIQRGTSDPDRVIVIAGHLDSRNTDIMDSTHDAPGADDDGSGTAAVLE